jgi:hypothetical protein
METTKQIRMETIQKIKRRKRLGSQHSENEHDKRKGKERK